MAKRIFEHALTGYQQVQLPSLMRAEQFTVNCDPLALLHCSADKMAEGRQALIEP